MNACSPPRRFLGLPVCRIVHVAQARSSSYNVLRKWAADWHKAAERLGPRPCLQTNVSRAARQWGDRCSLFVLAWEQQRNSGKSQFWQVTGMQWPPPPLGTAAPQRNFGKLRACSGHRRRLALPRRSAILASYGHAVWQGVGPHKHIHYPRGLSISASLSFQLFRCVLGVLTGSA
jgi:hypothetical protein